MHEKRRYGKLVLHRVTEAMPNQDAKDAARDIRADGYRARTDTWQGQFAVWSDKGLSDPTMPKRTARAPTVRRGRRSKPSIQRAYDEVCKDLDTPPKKFIFENRTWNLSKQVWSDKEQQQLRERHMKKGLDSVIVSFKNRGYLMYTSNWITTSAKPEHTPEDYLRASGHGKKAPIGVSGKLRGYKPPRTTTYKDKKWTRHSCHLNTILAKDEAKSISEEFHTVLLLAGTGTICVFIRARSRRKLPKKDLIRQEVFIYLDKVHSAGVSRERMIPVLMEIYGMTEATASNLVKRWVAERRIDDTPATHPGRKQVSKGVYMTRRERKDVRDKRTSSKSSGKRMKQPKLIDASVIGTKEGMASRAESILGVQVDEVYAVKRFGEHKDLLIMIRSGNSVKIYELLSGRTVKTKSKYVDRKLIDKFSATISKASRERAFRKELSRRGIH